MKIIISILVSIFCLSANAQTTQFKIDEYTSKMTIHIDSELREFIVHKPKKANQRSGPVPVVFMFHGSSGTGKKFYNMSAWKELGEKEGIITVYPTGLKTCLIKDGVQKTTTKWITSNKKTMLCPGETAQDDLTFVDAMVNFVITELNGNPNRIYAAGFSNGAGFIMNQLLPHRSHLFAAFGTSGSLLKEEAQLQGDPIPLYSTIGEEDPLFIHHNNSSTLPVHPDSILANNLLARNFEIMTNMLGLDLNSYKVRTKQKSTAFGFGTANGTDFGQSYMFAVMKSIKHNWPSGKPRHNGINLAEVFWKFFKKHKK